MRYVPDVHPESHHISGREITSLLACEDHLDIVQDLDLLNSLFRKALETIQLLREGVIGRECGTESVNACFGSPDIGVSLSNLLRPSRASSLA